MKPSSSETPSAVIAAIDKALQHVVDICTGKERWTMRVPCQPDTDSDCVIADALMEAKKALQSATAATPANARAVALLARIKDCLEQREADMPDDLKIDYLPKEIEKFLATLP